MVSVKVCFEADIRRASFANLGALVQFISSIPAWPETFYIRYRDDEDDVITISSDKELKEAFQFAGGGKSLRLEVVSAPVGGDSAFTKGVIPESPAHAELDALDEPGVIVKKSDLEEGEEEEAKAQEAESKDTTAERPSPESASTPIAAAAAVPAERKEESAEEKVTRFTALLDSLLQTVAASGGSGAGNFRHTRTAFAKELGVAFGTMKSVLEEANATEEKRPSPEPKPTPTPEPAAPASPAPAPAPVDRKQSTPAPAPQWDEQLAMLDEMGYTDSKVLIPLLAKFKGDISRVVENLPPA